MARKRGKGQEGKMSKAKQAVKKADEGLCCCSASWTTLKGAVWFNTLGQRERKQGGEVRVLRLELHAAKLKHYANEKGRSVSTASFILCYCNTESKFIRPEIDGNPRHELLFWHRNTYSALSPEQTAWDFWQQMAKHNNETPITTGCKPAFSETN